MNTSRAIANFFIKSSHDSGEELTPMKLVKLCYIAHGWHLGYFEEALLDEVVHAWKYGPVIDTVYHDFKHYGTSQITELYRDEAGEYPYPQTDVIPFLTHIWDAYKRYDGIRLSAMTHQENTPWDITWNKKGGKHKRHVIIPNDLIKVHYKEKIAEHSN